MLYICSAYNRVVKAQLKEQNLLVASKREFQDEVWEKVEERTRLYTWRQGLAKPLTRVCNSAVTRVKLKLINDL